MPSIWPFTSSSGPPSTAPHDASPASSPTTSSINPPLIIVEGFLSAAQSVVWGNEFRTYLGVGHQQLLDALCTPPCSPRKRRSSLGSDRTVVFAPIGPVSSLHDRACELFYALRGGVVDYGEQHALQHGHARFGREYRQPLCPTWGPRLPAHFLGHSLGGPTILKLQQLLRIGFFDHALETQGQEWQAQDLILSITSVSSPFRGTPLVYSLGSEPLPYPKVRMFSFGDLLSKFIHIAAFLDLPFFDAHADAWIFSARRRKAVKRSLLVGGVTAESSESSDDPESGRSKATIQERAGLTHFIRQLWKSDWAGGRDCAPWDCTFAERGRDRPEDQWGLEVGRRKSAGKTWYRSYAGGMTVATDDGFHRPESYWSLSPLTYTAHLIGKFDYSKLSPPPSFLPPSSGEKQDAMQGLSSSWWANDGVVPLASQFHPFDCHPETCRHFQGMPASLPSAKRKRRSQSSELRLTSPVTPPMSRASCEPTTLVDVDQQARQAKDELPLPATHSVTAASNRSMLGSARSAARIAYFTSLRAMGGSDPPLVTPSDEELGFLLPEQSAPLRQDRTTTTAPSESEDELANKHQRDGNVVQQELLSPLDNQWYTFEIDHLDHTSLCPFLDG